MSDSVIVRQIEAECDPEVAFYGEDEPFDPMPGVYRPKHYGSSGAAYLCYGRALALKSSDAVIAVVLFLDEFLPDPGDGRPWAACHDQRTRFVTRDDWNELALVRIAPISDGLREVGWA